MTWQQEFESKARENYGSRKLDEFVPELLPYLTSGMQVLDVGCGFGGLTMQVAQAVAPGAVVGIDPMESRIEQARTVSTESKLDNVSFSAGSAFSIDFPDNSFDLVYSNTVLHSLIDPVKALKEQKRVAWDRAWVVAAGFL